VDVTIQEPKFSFRSEYDISAAGSNCYAWKAFFSFRDKLQIQAEDGRVLARIRGHFSFIRMKHDFEFSDGRIYRFRCEKFWRGVFRCEGNQECFRLYQHKGLRYSIFQDERQIAAFSKNRVTIGKGNRYDIQMDADADLVVLLCLVLTVNTAENADNKATVTVDLGNIGPEDRPFDESWQPR
jgi:uncharacterized protein YxjI